MEELMFFIGYLSVLFLVIVLEVYILLNNKGEYLRRSYKAIEKICSECTPTNLSILEKEIKRFYDEYVQEDAQIKKFFPNVVIWLDAIIFRIDCGYKSAYILEEYGNSLKIIRDELEKKNPFNKCEKYQQDILCDISKLQTTQNEIVVQNILKRTEDEFIRLSIDIKKNARANKISITIGIAGILVSIIMAFVSF